MIFTVVRMSAITAHPNHKNGQANTSSSSQRQHKQVLTSGDQESYMQKLYTMSKMTLHMHIQVEVQFNATCVNTITEKAAPSTTSITEPTLIAGS